MAARPCDISLCVCPSAESPVTNVSAEAPDPLLFWGQIWNPYDPFAPPRLGDGLDIKVDCGPVNDLIALYNPIVYAGTQLLANLEALAASLGCPWPPSGDETFANDAQTATVYCPEGTAFTYTVEAGTLVSPPMDSTLGAAWLDWANAWASAYAYQQASALLDCIVPDDDIPDEPGDDPPTIPLGAGILPGPVWLCFGEAFFHRYTVSGLGSASYTLSITGGALPPGTSFVQDGARTCYITGTPTLPGIYSYTITGVSTGFPATNVSVTDYVYIMGITNSDSLPDADTGTMYSEALTAVGGTAPYTYALDTGSTLPGGLTLATDGTISGIPTEDGDFTFDVLFTDANGGECVQTVSLMVTGCLFSCNPEQNIILPAFSAPLDCTTDSTSGFVFGSEGGDVNKIDTSIPAIISTVTVDATHAILDMVYHPTTGLIYVSTSNGLVGSIYALNPSTMAVVGTVGHSLAATKLAVDAENERVWIGAQEPAPSSVFVLKYLNINTMTITDVANGDTLGTPFVAYIPSTSALGNSTGLVAFCGVGSQLTFYRASDLSLWGTLSLSANVLGIAGGFDPVTDGSLVFSYLSGGVYRIRALEVTPGFGEFTTAPFVAPAIGNSIQIDIGTTVGLALVPTFFIGGIQWQLDSIDSGTQITVTNLSVAPGTPIGLGTFVFGSGVYDVAFFSSQAVPTSVSYSDEVSAFILAHTTQVFVVDRVTHATTCTFTPSVAASYRPERCSISGTCHLCVPWQTGGVSDFYKVF